MKWETEFWPPEKKTVLVWFENHALPYCGYMKFAAGDKDCPYFVTYGLAHNPNRGDIIAWCDCLPDNAPADAPVGVRLYERGQATKEGRQRVNPEIGFSYQKALDLSRGRGIRQ